MKILFTRFPLESTLGGAEIQTLSLMEGLLARGHAVAFVGSCPVLLDACRHKNIPFGKLNIGAPPVTKWGVISFAWRKKKIQQQLKQILSQFHSLDAVVMLSLTEKLLLTPLLSKPDPRTYWLEHDRVGRWLTKNPWLPELKKQSTQATTIVVSDLSKKLYVDLGWNPESIVTIPNGIDPARLITPHPSPLTPHPSLHIGCLARLTPDKGVDLLVDAAKDLPDSLLTIVGRGRGSTLIQKMISSLEHVELKERVENLTEFYSSLDVFVLPSREHDPFGLVAAEAMMLGIPVIVTDVCGIADYLHDGTDALIVKHDSSAALKEALEKMQDPELRKRIGDAGQALAMSAFTIDRMVDAYVSTLTPGN